MLREPAVTPLLRCPFQKSDQLKSELDDSHNHLPGHPRVKINDIGSLYKFLDQELWPEELETMSSKLWWMSTQSSGNISPLHRQIVKRRSIVITEDPKLHLVWIDDRIFLKPLPHYLTSYSFWNEFLSDPSKNANVAKIRTAALGYLRTYFHLIQYESDLRIAQDPALSLVPKEVTWPQFCRFCSYFIDLTDDEVSGRYHYGEIRLTRLNYYAPFLLGKSHYQRVDYQYRTYFARFQGPVLFTFAFLSILLNSMQVNLAAATLENRYTSLILVEGCYWFSIITGILACLLLLLLVVLFVFKIVREWRFALCNRLERRKDQQRLISGDAQSTKAEVPQV